MFVFFQDDKLKTLVQKVGSNDWKYIASYIPVGYILIIKNSLVAFGCCWSLTTPLVCPLLALLVFHI